jgi:hypothetical protein
MLINIKMFIIPLFEEANARYRAVKIQPQWVVTPGKQTLFLYLE